ncbi:MAG: hypothetical protein A2W93_02515 [Bacteroidetes bacterium GWF2_43_63]|nr:MAG: hypothetical protein A2W94_08525 [Bacteroidetes bacterium GWE2_42_42]OFY53543.1 MAG: hypothetical protein A2W93_02515 [Bacteroidetes bacterium GWF2_43_63]HBG71127.1 hypothetical protein [Bacteroidales bacterium]HCB63704.1 hypothetical protein [Bacteroidales bacterium]HCY24453.1 hypothetical protein [Bacteroidales bacterium]
MSPYMKKIQIFVLFFVLVFRVLMFCNAASAQGNQDAILDFNPLRDLFKYHDLIEFKIDSLTWSERFSHYNIVDSTIFKSIFQDTALTYHSAGKLSEDADFYHSIQTSKRDLLEITILSQSESTYCTIIEYIIYTKDGKKTSSFTAACSCCDGGYYYEARGKFLNDTTYELLSEDNFLTENIEEENTISFKKTVVVIQQDGSIHQTETMIRTEIKNNNTISIETAFPINYQSDTIAEFESFKNLFEKMRVKPFLSAVSKLLNDRIDAFSHDYITYYTRPLEFNIVQSDFDFDIGKSEIDMMLLSRNDSAFYIRVSKKDTTVFLYQNEQILSDFISRHNAFYKSNIDIENKIQFPSNIFVFGYGCGFVGMPPLYFRKMQALVENKNYNEISSWLRSANPEIQAYGIYGMNELFKLGQQIQKADLEIIKHLFDSSTSLYSCSGCLYGEPLLFRKVIKPRDFRKLFREYKKYH